MGTGSATEKIGSASAGAAAGSKAAVTDKASVKPTEGLKEGKDRRSVAAEEAGRARHRRGRAIKLALLALGLLGIIVAFVVQSQDRVKQPTSARPTGAGLTGGASPKAAPAKVGEVVEKANLSASVMRVNRNFTHPDPGIKPAPGNRFVVVEFKLTNKDPKAVKISAVRQFNLRDSTKKQYEVSPIGAPDPKFPDGTVAPGQTITGWIAFQVPQDSTGLRLIFNPSVPV